MNEAWMRIFKNYIECFEAIQLLHYNGIFDQEEKAVHEHNLLFNIIDTMRSEIEE